MKKALILTGLVVLVAAVIVASWFFLSDTKNLATALDPNSKTLTFANGDWVPYQGESLLEGGPMSRIVKAAFESQGWEVKYVYLSWKEGLELSKKAKIDGSMLYSYNEERGRFFSYSDPVLQLDTVVFYNQNKPVRWEDPDDLKNFRLGGVEKYDYGFVREDRGYKLQRNSSSEISYERLAEGKLDGVLEELLVGLNIVREKSLRHRISFHPRPIKSQSYHLIIPKKHPRTDLIIKTFNKGLEEIRENGTFAELFSYN